MTLLSLLFPRTGLTHLEQNLDGISEEITTSENISQGYTITCVSWSCGRKKTKPSRTATLRGKR